MYDLLLTAVPYPKQACEELRSFVTSKADQASLRLTCKAFRALFPAKDQATRQYVSQQAGWQDVAAELKQQIPHGAVVVHADKDKDLIPLLQTPEVDLVHFDARPEFLCHWLSAPPGHAQEEAKAALQILQPVAELLLAAPPGHHIELSICIQASHLGNREFKAASYSLLPAITYLRVIEGVTACLPDVLLLFNLHTLVLTAPKKGSKIEIIKAALSGLTALHHLRVFSEPTSSATSINRLLGVLLRLPKVTCLKVVACKGLHMCLSASDLRYIHDLQLGSGVIIDRPPDMLMHLHLENISYGDQGAFQGYAGLFAQLQVLHRLVRLSVDKYCDESLCVIPSNLCLMLPTEQLADDRRFDLNNQEALTRLTELKVLRIGDFVTSRLVNSLSGVVLSRLHTFPFQLIARPHMGSKTSSEPWWIWIFSPVQVSWLQCSQT